jgi:hypothetical protein
MPSEVKMAGKKIVRKRGKDGRFEKEAPKQRQVVVPSSPHQQAKTVTPKPGAGYAHAQQRLRETKSARVHAAIVDVENGLAGNVASRRAAEERFGPIQWA